MRYLGIAAALLVATTIARADERVALPEEYKETFTEYLELDRTQNPDQFIRLFANAVALQGPDLEGGLPDGSVLVGEVYSVKKDSKGSVRTTALNRRIADQLLLIAVMEKRAAFGESPASPIATGDWDFAAYTPSGEAAPKNLDECRACHAPLTAEDFVFSIEHLPANAIDEPTPRR